MSSQKRIKGGILMKQELKFNLFYDNDNEDLEQLLISAIIHYLNNKKGMGLQFG